MAQAQVEQVARSAARELEDKQAVAGGFNDLRDFIELIEQEGQLRRFQGADANLEIGTISEVLAEQTGPMALFEQIPGYAPDIRLVSNSFATTARTARLLRVDPTLSGVEILAAWREGQAQPLAYARIVAPGVKYAEASIGRVITSAAARGTGLGRELVRRAVEQAEALFPGRGIRISAQAHLARFYGSFGFATVGEEYLEDGIPHIEMLRPPGLT